jgi:hypothetical protein
MATSLRERRMESEWLLLTRLMEVNPHIMRTAKRARDAFYVHLCETPGWIADPSGPVVVREHWVEYRFPRYYPALPVEAYCRRIPFHPNAHPVNGFLCLWADYAPSRSIHDAVVTTRAVLAHQAVNRDAQHCMQPLAFDCEPLTIAELNVPETCRTAASTPARQGRPRLTSIPDESVNTQDALAISHS